MKLLIVITVLVLIVNSRCVPFEGLFDTVKNTTGVIKNDISGLFSRGKSLLFGDSHEDENVKEGNPTIPSQGLLDKVSVKIHSISEGVQDTFQNVFKTSDGDEHEKGIIKNVYDKVKDKIGKAKEWLFNTKNTEDTKGTESSNVATGNDTIHINVTEVSNSVKFDGSGSIDIRTASENITAKGKEYSENVLSGVHKTYSKIEDDLHNTYVNSKKFDDFKETINENIKKGKNDLHKNVDMFIDGANKIGNDIDKRAHAN